MVAQSSSTTGVLGAAALAGIHHQRALLQCHTGEATRNDAHLVGDQNVRTKIDVTGGNALVDQDWHRREGKRGLCNVIGGLGFQLVGKIGPFLLGGGGETSMP